jgi:hypothetical protein
MRNSGFIPIGVIPYVLAAVVALALIAGAHEVGHGRGLRIGEARLAAYQAQAEAESEKLRAKAAEVRERVVIQYRDRIKEVRVPETVEVIREIEIIRKSGCTLPAEFRLLHDSATGADGEASGGTAGPAESVDCAAAIETIRENYKRARENAEQLKALQAWAAGVSQ